MSGWVNRVHIPRILLTHPFELCVSFCVMMVAIPAFIRGFPLSGSVSRDVTYWLAMAWQGGILLGGIMVFVSLLLRPPAHSGHDAKRVILQAVEQAGLSLTSGSAAILVAVLAWRGGTSGYVTAIFVAISAACILRIIALRVDNRATLDAYNGLTSGDTH